MRDAMELGEAKVGRRVCRRHRLFFRCNLFHLSYLMISDVIRRELGSHKARDCQIPRLDSFFEKSCKYMALYALTL
jgi:hypothetical protein